MFVIAFNTQKNSVIFNNSKGEK